MSSSLHQWESDPLFSAAEVVQDSADRMESIFRLLLHEQGLVHVDHPDPRLLKSIEYHRRDLATLLEATRWQLEDFERAVNTSASKDENQREDVILRHRQFVSAIRQHIINVENRLGDQSFRDSLRNSVQVSLNDQDRNGLAMFLSGGDTTGQCKQYEMDDSTVLRRFLDPASTAEIVDSQGKEIQNSDIEGFLNGGHNFCLQDSLREISYNGHGKGEDWDMEANDANKTFFQKSPPRGYGRGNIFQFFSNLWTAIGCRITRNYTKKLKDGEDQTRSAPSVDTSHTSQQLGMRLFAIVTHLSSQLGAIKSRYERMPYYQANRRSIQLVLTAVLVLAVVGLLLSRIS